MKIIAIYARIRCLQAFRFLQDAGWGYVVLLSPFLLVVIFRLLEMSLAGFPATALVALTLILGLQVQRKDRDFLSRLGPAPWLLRILDYSLVALPFALSILIVASYHDLIFLLPGILFIAILPPLRREAIFQRGLSMNRLPIEAMEWRAGLRRRGWLVVLLYVLGLATGHFMGSILALILLVSLVVAGFYEELEEKDLLEVFLPISGFLKRKLYWQGLCFHLLLTPAYLLFLFWHFPYWYLLLTTVLIGQSILCFSLFYKYSQWRPHQFRAYQQTALGLYLGGLIIPFLAPASLFYCWVCYRKAQANIEYYYGRNK